MTSDLRALQLEVADLREEVEDLRAEVVRLRRAITELRTGGLQPTIRESDLESVGSYSFVSEGDSRAGFAGASGAYSAASPTPAPTSSRAPRASPTPSSETGSARCPLTLRTSLTRLVGSLQEQSLASTEATAAGKRTHWPAAFGLW